MKLEFRSGAQVVGLSIIVAVTGPVAAHSQVVQEHTPLDSLIELALQVNPGLEAFNARATSFEALVSPAGAWSDPLLVIGMMNLPLATLDLDGTPMTQAPTVHLRQTVPFPGKQGLREGIAASDYATALAEASDERFEIANAVRAAYYDLYTLERSLEITERHQGLVEDLVHVANVRYTVGSGLQQDVLKSNVEVAQLKERWFRQEAQREAVAARLNALVNRPPETDVEAPALPAKLVRLAFSKHDTAGVRLAGSGSEVQIPPLSELIDAAMAQRPLLAAYRSRIERQQLATRLARKRLWPDFLVSLGYGLRGAGQEDFVSANVGVSLPVFAGRKQNRLIDAARAGEVRARAAYTEAVNRISARLAGLRAQLISLQDQLILYRDGILPQATAALQSATSAYHVGRVDFLTLVDSEATLYRYELDYHRLLAAFGKTAAEIERTVGEEIFF